MKLVACLLSPRKPFGDVDGKLTAEPLGFDIRRSLNRDASCLIRLSRKMNEEIPAASRPHVRFPTNQTRVVRNPNAGSRSFDRKD